MGACEEVLELTLGSDAKRVEINVRELKPRKDSFVASETDLEVTLQPKDGHASDYFMPPQAAAVLAFLWNQGFYERSCQAGIYNWLYKSLRPHENQSLAFEGKVPIVERLVQAMQASKWRPAKALDRRMQACFAASSSGLGMHVVHMCDCTCQQHVLFCNTLMFNKLLRVPYLTTYQKPVQIMHVLICCCTCTSMLLPDMYCSPS